MCLGHFEGTGLEDGLQLRGTRGVNYTGPTDDRQRTAVVARNSIKMYESIHGRARSRKTEWKTEASRYGVVGQPEKSKQRIPGLGSIEGFQEHHGNPQIWKRESNYLGPFPFPWVSDGWAICHGRVWNSSSHATSLFLSPCPLTTTSISPTSRSQLMPLLTDSQWSSSSPNLQPCCPAAPWEHITFRLCILLGDVDD